jgi:1-acyl-sn-glycerol-3-phosphate acyltransferase
VTGAHWRLVSLWSLQAARGAADGCAAGALLLSATASPSWPVTAAVLLGLFLLLPPVAGTVVDRHGARPVLFAAAALSLAGVGLWATCPGAWTARLTFLAAAVALNGPARDALLPLPRLVSAVRLATAGGVAVGLYLVPSPGVAGILYLLALLTTLPVHCGGVAGLPRDGFLRVGRCLLAHADTADPLLALAVLAVVLLGGGATACGLLPLAGSDDLSPATAPAVFARLCLGAAASAVLTAAQPHPSRVLAFVPVAGTALLGGLLYRAAAGADTGPGLDFLLGLTAALVSPLTASYLAYLPAEARGRGAAWAYAGSALLAALALGLLLGLDSLGFLATRADRLAFLAVLAVAVLAAGWWAFFRDFAEQIVELLIAPFYRVRVHGPGRAAFPLRGPVLVLANHAAWLDGVWVATVLPRRVVPLMISLFYDRPVLHWLMSRVVRAIRVQDTPYRREAPELAQAVAALDRGDCVLMFPEGVLRRRDEVTLRHFGQGVWRILRERPNTPVVVCWIEGGWGSMTSHRHGPPLVGKSVDWRRPIDIAVEAPQVLNPAVLADQQATRRHLEQACLDARRHTV